MTLNDEYLQILADLDGDAAGRLSAWEYLSHSTNIYRGTVVACDFFPKLFDARLRDRMSEVADTTYGIIEKIMDHYLADPEYRGVYTFDPRLEELILTPRGYESHLPFARIDLFLDEETLQARYCEFNADGSSGMNENREAENAIAGSASFARFAETHTLTSMNPVMLDGWVDEFLRIYSTWTHPVATPHVVLADYLESSVLEEFKLYWRLFEAHGVPCSIFDIRNLTYENGVLTGHGAYESLGHEGLPINAIWRRAVTVDVMDHYDESTAFLTAFREGAVCVIGSFLSHLVHDKQIFKVMRDERTWTFLTLEEIAFVKAAIPGTEYLSTSVVDIDAIKREPARWIIKPTDGYGCRDVFPGPSYSPEEWARIIDERADSRTGVPFLVQEFIAPYKTPSIAMRGNPGDETAPVQMNNNLTGMYLIDGRLSGIFSRLGPKALILGREGGLTAPSFWVDCESPFTAGQQQTREGSEQAR